MAPNVPAPADLLGGPPDRSWTTESGALLAARGDVVVKVHPARTDAAALTSRLRVAADPRLAGVVAAPLRPDPVEVLDDEPPLDLDDAFRAVLGDGPARHPAPGADGDLPPRVRLATVWPRLEVLAVDTPTAPWAQAARTLAALHRTPPGPDVPRHTARHRLRRAVERLRRRVEPMALTGPQKVLSAGRAVLDEAGRAAPEAPDALVHGDWHLGQLGRDRDGRWLLLDLDDLGAGDPAWDLGRPAGFWAAGLLDDATWTTFLDAYRAAGGPGVPAEGDPWPRLDVPARAEVVVAAARAVLRVLRGDEPWDSETDLLVEACARM